MALIGGALPSGHLSSGLRALKLEWAIGACAKSASDADKFQKAENPGTPRATMAAFAYMALPRLSKTFGARISRSLGEMGVAFDCSGKVVGERVRMVAKCKSR